MRVRDMHNFWNKKIIRFFKQSTALVVVGALLISIILPPFAQAKQTSSSKAESFQFRGRPLSVKSPTEQQVVLNKYIPQNSNLQPLDRNMGFSNSILNNAKEEFDLIREKSVKIFETVLDYAVQCYYKVEEKISQDWEDSLELLRQIFLKTPSLIPVNIDLSNLMNRRVKKARKFYVAMTMNRKSRSKTSSLANIFRQKKDNVLSPHLSAMSGRKKDGKSGGRKIGDTSLNSNMSPELSPNVRTPLSRARSIFFYPRAFKAAYLYEVELYLKSIPQESLASAPLIRMEEIKSEEELLNRLYRRERVVEHFRRQWFDEKSNPPAPVTWLAWDPIQHLFELISFNETFKSLDIEKWGIRGIVKEYLYSKGSHDKLSEILVDPTRVNMRVIGEYDPDKAHLENASDLIALPFVVPVVTYLSAIVLAGFFGIVVDANSLWGSAISAVFLAIVINEVGHMIEVNWKKPFKEWSWPKFDTKGVIAFDDWPPGLQKVLGFRLTVPGAHGSSGIYANLVAAVAIFAVAGFHW